MLDVGCLVTIWVTVRPAPTSRIRTRLQELPSEASYSLWEGNADPPVNNTEQDGACSLRRLDQSLLPITGEELRYLIRSWPILLGLHLTVSSVNIQLEFRAINQFVLP